MIRVSIRPASLILSLLFATGLGFAQAPAPEHVPGRLLAQSVDGVPDSAIAPILAAVGAKVHHTIDQIHVQVLDVPEPALDAVSQALMRSGRFTFVERDFVAHPTTTPNDPDFPSQWHLTKIQAPNAWSVTIGSASIPIAVIDSGADPTHPDLAPKLIPGWNFLTGTTHTSDTGCSGGHGTAVAGAAAADTNNLTGVAGVGWANTIMPLVALDASCSATYSNMASAMNYAADHGVRIINISLGGTSASSTLQSAVNYAWSKGAVVFAAAGNSSNSTPIYPAACNYALAISATEPTDTLASFSNYGNWISLSAPGDNILTTEEGGGYWYCYGTSLSTPVAAGVGALALSANPSLTASQLVTLLEQNSDDLGSPGYDQYFGWGRVNAYKAVAAAKGITPDTTPPKVGISSPLAAATVAGTVAVTGVATDNVGVTKVEFFVDGSLSTTGTASSFSFSWNTATKANGSHTLMVEAFDAAGNTGSASVSVSVNNPPPKVAISSPLAGATDSGTIAITGTATDNLGVAKVEFFVDGSLSATGTVSSFSFSWNTATKANGSHTLMVEAFDAVGNTGSASVSVNVNNTPPKVAISSPLAGATVAGTIAVTGAATDNVGVTKVEFFVDGILSTTGTSPSFSFSLNTTTKANGSHTLMVEAFDAAGNTGSASVTVNVNNVLDTTPPKVAISSPLAGATVTGTIAVNGTATDNVGVTKVEFFVDGILSTTGTSPAFSFSLNTTTKANGSHTLMVKAFDAAGNTGCASVTVTVNNPIVDTIPPSVAISSPVNGAYVSGTVLVKGTAADNVGVTKIQFYANGGLVSTATSSPFSFSWSTAGQSNGPHTLVVTAYDAAGNSKSASVTVNVDTIAPVVAITSPANGSRTKTYEVIDVSATDNVSVSRVSIYIDNVLAYTGTSGPYTYTWYTHLVASGNHVITATAWDEAGNAGHSASVTVTKQ